MAKNKRWLKYGLILAGLNIILWVIYGLLSITGIVRHYDDLYSLLILPSWIIAESLGFGAGNLIMMVVVSSIVWFLIGAIIGLIIQLIKSRKSKK